jgi:two-component system response regulator HydG
VPTLAQSETERILTAMRACRNNQTKAAKVLGIGRNTLWRKLKRIRYEVERRERGW